jgi:hypothetical protein
MFVAVPDIEDNFALPANAVEALPDLSPVEELNMRARTITMLAELTGEPLVPDESGQTQARALAKQMMQDPHLRPDYAKYPNDVMAYLAGLVAQSNCMIVDDLAELKLYVVNKLVHEVEHAKDSKSRITALKALGEIDGVDAFKKRSEVTVTHKSITEVENELKGFLDRLELKDVEEATVIEPKNDENPENSGDFAS